MICMDNELIKTSEIPPLKSELKKAFGFLSFECVFMNIDAVGVLIVKTGQMLVILYRGAMKIGYIYEMEGLSEEKQNKIYQDVPSDRNKLEAWAKDLKGKVQLYIPPKHNYVFVSDDVVTTNKILKQIK